MEKQGEEEDWEHWRRWKKKPEEEWSNYLFNYKYMFLKVEIIPDSIGMVLNPSPDKKTDTESDTQRTHHWPCLFESQSKPTVTGVSGMESQGTSQFSPGLL